MSTKIAKGMANIFEREESNQDGDEPLPEGFELRGRWIKRFKNQDVENVYTRVSARRLLKESSFLKCWGIAMVVWLLNAIRFYVSIMAEWSQAFVAFLAISQGIVFLLIQIMVVLHLVGKHFPRDFRPEATIVAATIAAMICIVAQSKWRVWQLCEDSPPNREELSSDIMLIVALNLFFPGATHLFHLRTCISWILPVSSTSIYLICSLPSGMSPEPRREVLLVTIISAWTQWFTWSNQWYAEMAHRRSWAKIVVIEDELEFVKTQSCNEERRSLEDQLDYAIESESPASIDAIAELFFEKGFTHATFQDLCRKLRRRRSEESGVCVRYLLSHEFLHLVRMQAGSDDPSFYEMKDSFFKGPNALGASHICPRDGEKGCALVDTLQRGMRGQCTHFLSWTWAYRLSEVKSGISMWLQRNIHLEAAEVMFFMCFFVNNQYRILVENGRAGSLDLEAIFETRLRKIGRVVALLDAWDEPLYLTRIWTIFEQYTASKLGVGVEIILPEQQSIRMLEQIRKGEAGIQLVKKCLCKVDAEAARAWDPRDEMKVKSLIRLSDGGFAEVNRNVKRAMIDWIGQVVAQFMQHVVEEEEKEEDGALEQEEEEEQHLEEV